MSWLSRFIHHPFRGSTYTHPFTATADKLGKVFKDTKPQNMVKAMRAALPVTKPGPGAKYGRNLGTGIAGLATAMKALKDTKAKSAGRFGPPTRQVYSAATKRSGDKPLSLTGNR